MSKDSYIYECFGIDTVTLWTNLFVNFRTSSLVNSLHRIIYYVV